MSGALSVTGNDRIHDGANMSPFDAHKVNVDDLTEEARVWLDGKAVETADEAADVETLLDMARKAALASEKQKLAETKPLRDQVADINARWRPITDGATRIAELCKRVLTPWREKQEALRKAEAERAAAEAEEQRQREVEASRQAAQSGSLIDREVADQEAAAAKMADKLAKTAGKDATTGLGLRGIKSLVVVDPTALARWLWKEHPKETQQAHADLARKVWRPNAPALPGTEIHEERKAV